MFGKNVCRQNLNGILHTSKWYHLMLSLLRCQSKMAVEIVAYASDKQIGLKEGICREFYQYEMWNAFPV